MNGLINLINACKPILGFVSKRFWAQPKLTLIPRYKQLKES